MAEVRREDIRDKQVTVTVQLSDEVRTELLHMLTFPSHLGVTTMKIAIDRYTTVFNTGMASGVRATTDGCEIASLFT